jgi:translation initiation factor IF-2
MSDSKGLRLSKIARELNVGITTIVESLKKKGHDIDSNPNTKITPELHEILLKEFGEQMNVKKDAEKISLKNLRDKKDPAVPSQQEAEEDVNTDVPENEEVFIKNIQKPAEIFEHKKVDLESNIRIVGKVDLDSVLRPSIQVKKEAPKQEKPVVEEIKEEKIIVEEPEKIEVAPVAVKEEEVIPEPEKEHHEVKHHEPKHHEIKQQEEILQEEQQPEVKEEVPVVPEQKESEVKVVGRIDLDALNQKTRPTKKTKQQKEDERKSKKQIDEVHHHKAKIKAVEIIEDIIESPEETVEVNDLQQIEIPDVVEIPEVEGFIKTDFKKLTGPTVVGRIDLPVYEDKRKPVASSDLESKKRKRKRIRKEKERVSLTEPKPATPPSTMKAIIAKKGPATTIIKKKKRPLHQEVNEEEVQKQIKDTLARLTSKGKSKTSKYRREKRDLVSLRHQEEVEKLEQDKNILKVTEFVSVNELSSMMDVPVNEVISTCMNLGLFVSINQRLDAETMALVADEFNYKVEFVSVEVQEAIKEDDNGLEENMVSRPPIVTIMGHVDHGKTKLLDYIRKANVISGEAGGITQHIGAYGFKLSDGRQITFLDTPGHEAFTAMRARGAQVTDVVIIVVAADDGVMPQTVEAINHATAAGVPLIFAINKIDKPDANPERIKEELAKMNFLVEDWGGKYQSQEISAKSGKNIDLLLDKILLEAEMLNLKADPKKRASGKVLESSLDKGRGYVVTLLVQSGTLKIGDIVLAGTYTGHVKAMYNEHNQRVMEAGPAQAVLILGLDGAPQAGDNFNVMENDKEAKDIATKRGQLQREQGLRTQKHITLDEIGRRIAIGNFQELNVIVKGDVDGSIEALSDALIKLSNPEIQVNVIHKAVGQISESDIILAAASNAIIIGFQVRPSMSARKLAEKEEIDIRLYSIIYDAINELKAAMEGMLSPEIREEIVATLEVREVFKITKVGTIAGCLVKEGKIARTSKVRLIRDGIVVFSGELGSLKRFKDDAKEVVSGLECGLNIVNFNDLKEGDIIEGYKETEIKKKL